MSVKILMSGCASNVVCLHRNQEKEGRLCWKYICVEVKCCQNLAAQSSCFSTSVSVSLSVIVKISLSGKSQRPVRGSVLQLDKLSKSS